MVARDPPGVAVNMVAVDAGSDAALLARIEALDAEIVALKAGVATNTSGVATNASNIATNTSGVATNASNIATNTSGVATNASNIATNTSGVATNASNIATNTSGVAALDAAQPFAVTARDDFETVTSTDEVVVAVSVTAPVAGQVTVNSTTLAIEPTAGDGVGCSITTGISIDFDYEQQWASPGSPGSFSQLAGTRTFNIAAGATGTYNLVCNHFGVSGSSLLFDSVLTAIFTPAP